MASFIQLLFQLFRNIQSSHMQLILIIAKYNKIIPTYFHTMLVWTEPNLN